MTCAKPETDAARPRLRWYQYRLRTLLLFVLLVNIAMSVVATKMRAARRQRDAVAAIEKSGGSVWYDHEVDESGFSLLPGHRPPPWPSWLRKLLGDDFFRTVVTAYVESDASFEPLKQLDRLQHLSCDDSVTEAGLAHLKELRQLRDLDLMTNPSVAAGLEHITALTQLEELNLSNTDVGDAELERLKGMTQLRYLGLVGTRITDAGLRHLEGLTRLEELALNKTQIGDAGVAHLKGLKQLKRLGLGNTRVTDASLEHLIGLKNLVRLELQFTSVTAEGVRKIDRALPHCDIRTTLINWLNQR